MGEHQQAETWSRRRFLAGLGSAGIASLAGCSALGSDGGSDGDSESSPPGTSFSVEFDPAASNYTIKYEGDRAFTEDNTGLLAIDHVAESDTLDRMIWFGGPEFGPVEPGQSTLWGYDTERVTAIEVVWAPPEAGGSGRAPQVLAQRSAP